MLISDWSSDVCSSDLAPGRNQRGLHVLVVAGAALEPDLVEDLADDVEARHQVGAAVAHVQAHVLAGVGGERVVAGERPFAAVEQHVGRVLVHALLHVETLVRSEEHTSELQSLMRISSAVFCLYKKKS